MVAATGRVVDEMPPRSLGTEWPGVGLSLLVHGLLVAALAWGVRWQSTTSDLVSAELWAAVPQASPPPAAAVPPPPPPPPRAQARSPAATTPRDADIALEKARREKAEQERQRQAERERADRERRERAERADQLRREQAEKAERAAKAEREAKARAAAEARERAAAEQREAKQREENLARMMGQLGGTGGPSARGGGSAGTGGAPSAGYAGRIVAAIKPNIVFAESLPGNPSAEVEVRAGPGGTIIGRTLLRSSGHADWDDAVLRAIDRTGSLPKDTDGRVPSRLTITFRYRD